MRLFALLLLALAATLPAHAQGGFPGGPPPFPLLQALDKDHDGTLSAKEIAGAAAALKTLDKNRDGKLTRDEMLPPPPPGGFGGPRPAPPAKTKARR